MGRLENAVAWRARGWFRFMAAWWREESAVETHREVEEAVDVSSFEYVNGSAYFTVSRASLGTSSASHDRNAGEPTSK